MDSSKRISMMIGVLYIIGTVSGVLSVVFTGPIGEAADYVTGVGMHETLLMLGALMVLIMGLSLAMIPVVFFPLARRINRMLAVGFVVFRGALETVTYLFIVGGWLFLISLHGMGEALDASVFNVFAAVILDGEAVSVLTTVVFIAGAVMFYYLLFQARLVPRWLSGWGLLGAVPYLLAGFLVMFGVIEHFGSLDALLRMPLGVQEMVLAVWLIVKGFSQEGLDDLDV